MAQKKKTFPSLINMRAIIVFVDVEPVHMSTS